MVFIHEQCFAQIPACEFMKMPFACQQSENTNVACSRNVCPMPKQHVEQVIFNKCSRFQLHAGSCRPLDFIKSLL